MTLTFRLAPLAALLLCTALPARADWTGTLRIRTEPKGPHGEGDQDGTVVGKGTKLRYEFTDPRMGKTDMVVDLRAHKSMIISESRKQFMVMDVDQARGSAMGGMKCDSDDVVVCLKNEGFAKLGTEVVNGKKSDRWERDHEGLHGTKMHETFWVPVGVKDFAVVKQIIKAPDRTVTVDVLEFQEGSVPDSKFAAPAGYSDMSAHMGQMMGAPPAHTGPGAPPPAGH